MSGDHNMNCSANQALDKMAENARALGLDYEPAQKPVAWYDAEKDCAYTLADCEGRAQDDLEPLYLAPPSKPWVGLTDEEMREVYKRTDWDMAGGWEYERAIEAKLREKNA